MTSDVAPVIGVVGNDVPRQIVLAAGARPHRLTGLWDAPADPQWVDLLGGTDPVAATIAEELAATPLDGLLVSNDSQAHLRLFYVLRATGPAVPVHLVDLPRRDSPGARRFLRHQFAALAGFCAEITGRAVDRESLAAAAAAEAALGGELDRLRERRRAEPPTCSGTDALRALLTAMRASPGEAIEAVRAAGRATDGTAGRRIHVTGSNHPDPRAYAALEAAGLVVVSEDHDTGDGAWLGVSATGASVDEVFERLIDAHFARIPAAATGLGSDRARTTRKLATDAGADVVVALIRDLDEAPLWDVADQREALADAGVQLHVEDHIRPGEVAARAAGAAVAVGADVARSEMTP